MANRAKNQLIIMDKTGHSTLYWPVDSVDDDVETLKAATKFKELTDKGYLGYKVASPGEGEAIDVFDKEAEQIIMSPQLYGG